MNREIESILLSENEKNLEKVDNFLEVDYKNTLREMFTVLLESIKKRSIDDIIKCAIDSTLSSFDQKYIFNNRSDITQEIKNRMALACIPFGFIIDSFGMTQIMSMPDSSANQKFKPHVCRDDGPIQFDN